MTGLAQSGQDLRAEQLYLFTPPIEREAKIEHHVADAEVLEPLDPGGAPSDQLAFEIFDRSEAARGG